MPFIHGKTTSVWFNATDLSGFLNATDFAVDVDAPETSVYGNGWKTFIAGTPDATVGFGGFYDPTTTVPLATAGVDGSNTTGILTYCPGGGATVGDKARLVKATATNYAESSPVGGVVTFAWAVHSTDMVGFGDVLHPLGIDTNTTTGTEKDDAAATATGWTAHLHVIAVSGGSWVVKLQDAAVTNTHSDVSGGAFTAATGATQQRLESSTTTAALRRYVRYVATRTGGTAGDTITFALAYSRSV